MPVPYGSSVSTSVPPTESLAQRLLDAQVAYHLARLTGDQLESTVSLLADDLFAAAGEHRIEDLVDREAIKAIVVRALGTVPGSAAVSGIVELATTVVYDGPDEPFPLGELLDREQVAVLLDELLALNPVVERALERLTDSPLVGTMASRFMGRVVGEVLQANKAVAEKVPGLGSLMSFGTSAASKVMGAADKQFEGLIGDSVGKGGTFAVRRLNRIVIETLRDPTTREALLQVWDLLAEEPVAGLSRYATREEISGVVDAVHELSVTTVAHEHVAHLGETIVEAFFERFGAHTPTGLLAELELSRADLVADLVRIAPPVVEALRESGDLERIAARPARAVLHLCRGPCPAGLTRQVVERSVVEPGQPHAGTGTVRTSRPVGVASFASKHRVLLLVTTVVPIRTAPAVISSSVWCRPSPSIRKPVTRTPIGAATGMLAVLSPTTRGSRRAGARS